MLINRYFILVICLLNCHGLVMGQCSYDYSKTITISSSQVSGSSDLSNFPVLISLTDDDLRSTAYGGHITNSSGYDIRFMQVDCSCWLDHQIEKYDETTGELIVWVKVDNLSYSEDTEIEIYYGNSSISVDQSSENVWNSNYVSRYHLDQDPSGTTTDITGNANDGSLGGGGMNSSDLVPGKIGSALDFDGNDYLDLGSNNKVGSNFTISFWIQSYTANTSNHGILGGSASNNYRPPTMYVNNSTKIRSGFGTGSSWNVFNTTGNAISDNSGNWHHVVYKYDGTSHIVMVDGSVSKKRNQAGLTSYDASVQFLGRAQNTYFIGKIDEVSFSNVARSDDWLITEFNNQNSPETFYTVGSEKEADCSGPGGVDLADGTGDLVLWLKGDCGLKDADGDFPNDGESIKDWMDQSGTGNDYYQSSASSRPIYMANTINDYPGIYMTGPQFINGPNVTFNEATVFFVINASDYSTRSRLFNNSSYSLRFEQWYNTGNFGYTRYGVADYNSGVSTPYGESIILSFTKEESASSYTIKKILNGEVVSSGSMNVGSSTAPVPLEEMGYFTQGYIPEVIIFNRLLDENEEGLVQDYLTGKYGIESPRITGTNGPGGIGDTLGTDALKMWLKADTKVTYDGSNRVSSWENIVDFPGLDISALGSARPTYEASSTNFNNCDVISFDGGDKLVTSTTLSTTYFPTDAATVFVVANSDNYSQSTHLYATDPLTTNRFSGHLPWGNGNYYFDIGQCCGSTARVYGSYGSNNTTYIWDYSANATEGKHVYRNGTLLNYTAGTSTYTSHASQKFQMGWNYRGDIAEFIMYDQKLNGAERVIVENYLAEKYNVSMGGIDYFTGHTGEYIYEIQGIGTTDGTLDNGHIKSQNSGGLEITMVNNSFDAANEFAFVGYKETENDVVADDVPPGVEKRFKRAWYLDVTGSIDIELNFNLNSSGIGGYPTGGDYVLLYSPTNAFSFVDWTAAKSITASVSTSNVKFIVTSSDLVDGYYTLATTNASGSPLPIVLINFDAEVENKKRVKLNWSTASEYNNDKFIIQRSPTGYNWEEILEVDGAGTSHDIKNYETVDTDPHPGTSYYRLKQVDFDGKSSYSPIVSVEVEEDGEILVYPNPSSDKIYITKTKGNIEYAIVNLYNQIGKKQNVSVDFQNGALSYDVSKLQNGIYFVEVVSGNLIGRYKIIVSH